MNIDGRIAKLERALRQKGPLPSIGQRKVDPEFYEGFMDVILTGNVPADPPADMPEDEAAAWRRLRPFSVLFAEQHAKQTGMTNDPDMRARIERLESETLPPGLRRVCD